jgi:hypothetical protein
LKKHLIIATYDGINTHYCGVGTIAKNLVIGLNEFEGISCPKVSIAYIKAVKESKIFNQQCYEDSLKLTKTTGGHFIFLDNGLPGESEWDMWGSFKEWDKLCQSLVRVLNTILKGDEENFIILSDTPFLMFAKYQQAVNIRNLKCFYFPMSSGENHAFGNELWRMERIKMERECFNLIAMDKNSKVLSLGKSFAKRMTDDYGVQFADSDYLNNGLCLSKYVTLLNKKYNNSDLAKYGIDLLPNDKIIFSWGRCSVTKGFRELAEAWLRCQDDLPHHYLILQIPDNSGENSYYEEIKALVSGNKRVMIIDDFNPDIWKTILRNNNTVVVCIPSIMDPFPHTAIEAKLLSKDMNYITVVSQFDGAVDAFNIDECFYVSPTDLYEFAHEIVIAATLSEKERREIIIRNESTIDKFNFPKILERFIISNLQQ